MTLIQLGEVCLARAENVGQISKAYYKFRQKGLNCFVEAAMLTKSNHFFFKIVQLINNNCVMNNEERDLICIQALIEYHKDEVGYTLEHVPRDQRNAYHQVKGDLISLKEGMKAFYHEFEILKSVFPVLIDGNKNNIEHVVFTILKHGFKYACDAGEIWMVIDKTEKKESSLYSEPYAAFPDSVVGEESSDEEENKAELKRYEIESLCYKLWSLCLAATTHIDVLLEYCCKDGELSQRIKEFLEFRLGIRTSQLWGLCGQLYFHMGELLIADYNLLQYEEDEMREHKSYLRMACDCFHKHFMAKYTSITDNTARATMCPMQNKGKEIGH